MLIDFELPSSKDESRATIEDLSLRTLQLQNGTINRARSQSNQNLASGGGISPSSFAAQPHMCGGSLAPTTNQLPAPINSIMSPSSLLAIERPTLIKQFSQASSCAADSPSPVERDGVSSGSSNNSKGKNSLSLKSAEVQYTSELDADTSERFVGDDRPRTYPEKSTHLQKKAAKDQQYLGAALHSSLPFRSNKAAPNHSHSNPEFPLTTHISMNQTERTHSFDDLYTKKRRPPFQAQAEDKVSPSREKINSLSSHIYSSLDQNLATTLSSFTTGSYHHILKDSSNPEANPVCEVMQKIIDVTTPLLNLNQSHIQTLMRLSGACNQSCRHREARSLSSYVSHNSSTSHFAEEESVHESPVACLLDLGYKLVEKPLTVAFGVPSEGYMTLTFRLVGESSRKKDALLKVKVICV